MTKSSVRWNKNIRFHRCSKVARWPIAGSELPHCALVHPSFLFKQKTVNNSTVSKKNKPSDPKTFPQKPFLLPKQRVILAPLPTSNRVIGMIFRCGGGERKLPQFCTFDSLAEVKEKKNNDPEEEPRRTGIIFRLKRIRIFLSDPPRDQFETTGVGGYTVSSRA